MYIFPSLLSSFYLAGQQAIHLAAQGQGCQADHRRGEGQEAWRQGLDSPGAQVFHAPDELHAENKNLKPAPVF